MPRPTVYTVPSEAKATEWCCPLASCVMPLPFQFVHGCMSNSTVCFDFIPSYSGPRKKKKKKKKKKEKKKKKKKER